MFKRLITLLLASAMLLSLCGCATQDDRAYASARKYMDDGNYLLAAQAFSQLERYQDIPAGHYQEAARVMEQIENWKRDHPNHMILGAVSDLHVNGFEEEYALQSQASVRHAAFALEVVGTMTNCDFVVNLGDTAWENGLDTETAMADAAYVMSTLNASFTRLDAYHIPGNHDKSDDTQAQFDLIGAHNFYNHTAPTPIRGYGSRDYPAKKVRVIFLNTVDYLNASGGHGLSYEQKDWLMRQLDVSELEDPEQWQILIFSHIPLDFSGGDYNTGDDINAILTAYTGGLRVSIPVVSEYCLNEDPTAYPCYRDGQLVYDYSGRNAARVIANIHGHVHTNAYGKMEGSGILRMSTPNVSSFLNKTESYPDHGSYSIEPQEAAKLEKQPDAPLDTSVTFYCIDLEVNSIHAFGYGANTDRACFYRDAEVYTVEYNLENAWVTPQVSSALEGEPLRLNVLTDEKFDVLIISVTMGDVSITEAVYSDGTIDIPAVTGDLYIKALASKSGEYKNLFNPEDPDFADAARFNSAGETVAGSGFCSGFIPVGVGDIIRTHCPGGNYKTHEVGNNIRCLAIYDENKELIAAFYPGETDAYLQGCEGFQYMVVEEGAAYFRVSGHPHGNYQDFIVTKNQQIILPLDH